MPKLINILGSIEDTFSTSHINYKKDYEKIAVSKF